MIRVAGFCQHCGKRLDDDDDAFCSQSCQASQLGKTYFEESGRLQARHNWLLIVLFVLMAAAAAAVGEWLGAVVLMAPAFILARVGPLR